MAISKITLNGVVQMDLTSDTVTAQTLLDDYTAHGADGNSVTGELVMPTARTASDVTVSGATVTVPAGAYSSQVQKSVASGTAGTPTASKGTVSSHAITVTPSVTNTTGYITGGTKTGTGVSVSASELVSGTLNITSSGTKDVTNYASASVSAGTEGTPTATKGTVSNHSVTVTPSVTNTGGYISGSTKTGTAVTVTASELASGNKAITENGTGVDVVGYSTVSVSVVDTYTLEYQWDSEEHWPVFDDTYANIKAAVLANKTFKYTSYGDDVIGAWYANCYATNYNGDNRIYTECVRFYLEGEGKIWRVFYGYSDGSLEIETEAIYLIPSGNKQITANGTGIDVATYSTVSVAVPVPYTETDIKNMIERKNYFTSFTIPSSTTAIGIGAFYGCYYLNLTSLPNGITSIGNYAFYDCREITLASLPSGITSIGSYAFFSCYKLALTSLPSGLTSINSYAFNNCREIALTSLPSGITSIGERAFTGCPKLALTSLPSGITSIGSYAFATCPQLAITTLPSSLITLNSAAFQSCSGLTTITCTSSTLNSISAGVFTGSSTYPMQLREAHFPYLNSSGSTTSGAIVFGSTTATNACQQLEIADLGNLWVLVANAFANCYKLQTLVLRKTAGVCTLNNVSAFTNTPFSGYNSLTGTVYVPNALISSYQQANNWSTLYNNGTVEFVKIEGSQYEL